jgi:hypothetical protein
MADGAVGTKIIGGRAPDPPWGRAAGAGARRGRRLLARQARQRRLLLEQLAADLRHNPFLPRAAPKCTEA